MPDNNQKNRQPQQQTPQDPGRDVERKREGQFGGGDQQREPQRGGQGGQGGAPEREKPMPNQGQPGKQEVEREPARQPQRGGQQDMDRAPQRDDRSQKPAEGENKPGINRDDEDMGGR